jgi:glycosyltransferase involved in cell wall biosynthesis
VTPTYNRARFLPETIESVLGQTYPNIEYLVLDDGSTDNTAQVVARYGGRLRFLRHPNAGESFTVNKGFRLARGEFITAVNSDDPVRPEFVATAVDFLRSRPELLMAYPDWLVIDERSRVLGTQAALEYDYLEMVRIWGCIPGPGAMLRRRALHLESGRDVRYRYVADFEYWLRLGRHGPFARIPAALATHRHHSNSAGVELKDRVAREIVSLAKEFFRRPELPPEVRRLRSRALSSAHYEAGYRLLTDSPCNQYLLKSVAYDPVAGYRRMRRCGKVLERRIAFMERELARLRYLERRPVPALLWAARVRVAELLPAPVRRKLGRAIRGTRAALRAAPSAAGKPLQWLWHHAPQAVWSSLPEFVKAPLRRLRPRAGGANPPEADGRGTTSAGAPCTELEPLLDRADAR